MLEPYMLEPYMLKPYMVEFAQHFRVEKTSNINLHTPAYQYTVSISSKQTDPAVLASALSQVRLSKTKQGRPWAPTSRVADDVGSYRAL